MWSYDKMTRVLSGNQALTCSLADFAPHPTLRGLSWEEGGQGRGRHTFSGRNPIKTRLLQGRFLPNFRCQHIHIHEAKRDNPPYRA
jgi:hypothetical protein